MEKQKWSSSRPGSIAGDINGFRARSSCCHALSICTIIDIHLVPKIDVQYDSENEISLKYWRCANRSDALNLVIRLGLIHGLFEYGMRGEKEDLCKPAIKRCLSPPEPTCPSVPIAASTIRRRRYVRLIFTISRSLPPFLYDLALMADTVHGFIADLIAIRVEHLD